jgi:hypothetical protein
MLDHLLEKDAAFLEEELVQTSTGPRGCEFHQHHPNDYKNEDGSYRGTTADPLLLGHGPEYFKDYKHARLWLVLYMCFYYLVWSAAELMYMCFYYLVWSAAKLMYISFGTYRLNMHWVLLLFVLSKHMLFFVFLLVGLIGIAVAPRATLKALYRSEVELYGCAAHFELHTRELPGQQSERTFVLALPVFSFTLVVLELVSAFYGDVGFLLKCLALILAFHVVPNPWE